LQASHYNENPRFQQKTRLKMLELSLGIRSYILGVAHTRRGKNGFQLV
jgi:hypothetical protein